MKVPQPREEFQFDWLVLIRIRQRFEFTHRIAVTGPLSRADPRTASDRLRSAHPPFQQPSPGSHLQGAYAERRPQPSKNTIQKSKNTNNLWFARSQHELGSSSSIAGASPVLIRKLQRAPARHRRR